jgi:phenylacetate-CoA ligase
MADSLVRRAQGTLTILRRLPGQRRVPFLPAERVRELRDERLRELVSHAAATVPHYADLDPREFHSADDLSRLPLLEKRLVQAEPGRFRSTAISAEDTVTLATAGSTGMPVHVPRDRNSLLAMVAYSERERVVESRLCGARYRYPVLQIVNPRGNVVQVLNALGRTSFRPLRPRLHDVSVSSPVEEAAQEIARVRPRVIRGFGSYIELLFRALAAGTVSFPLPRVVLYAGDALSPEGRELIRTTFGVPVISRYAAAEAIRIGYFCELGTGFHLHEDLCHVSVVGPDGRPAPPGERGEVVVTDLTNRLLVLVNYRLGDFARIGPDPCPCGRSSRLLTHLEGRTSDVIRLRDGTFVHPLLLEGAIRRLGTGVLRFQVVQEEPDSFLVKLVTADSHSFAHACDEVVPVLREWLRGASVEAERHDEIDAEPSGKFRSFVLLPQQTAAAPPARPAPASVQL